jgi:CRISPR type IV-associated protein Csf2
MSYQNRIEGILTLTTPMHCATTGGTADAEGNANITRIQSERVVTPSGVQWIPFFPGNDLRGRLRRKAANILIGHIGAVSPQLYAGLHAGTTGAPPESEKSVEEINRAKKNPFMGLFGGGRRMLESRYRANDLCPVIQDNIAIGRVPAHFGNVDGKNFLPSGPNGPLSGWEIKSSRTSFLVNDILRMTDPTSMQEFVTGGADAIAQRQIELLSGRADRKKDKQAAKDGEIKASDVTKKSDGSNMFEYEYIIPGTPMYCLFDMENDTTDEHFGMFLLALLELVREQALGGWVRIGFGRFNADLTLTRNGQKYQIFKEGMNGAQAVLSDDVFENFCKPAIKALKTLTVSDMAEFYIGKDDEDGHEKEKANARVKSTAGEAA